VRRHHLGMDATLPLVSLVLRADGVFQSRKIFYQRDFVSYEAPVIQGVLGVEYQSGDPDKLLILEGYALRILRSQVPDLLIYQPTTVGLSALIRWTLVGRLGGEARLSAGLQPRMYVVQPQLTWKQQAWTIILGGLALGGEPYSFGHYYRRNAEVFAKVKLSF